MLPHILARNGLGAAEHKRKSTTEKRVSGPEEEASEDELDMIAALSSTKRESQASIVPSVRVKLSLFKRQDRRRPRLRKFANLVLVMVRLLKASGGRKRVASFASSVSQATNGTAVAEAAVCSRALAQDPRDLETAGKVRQLMALREANASLRALSDFAKEYGDEAFCRRLLRKYDGNMRRCSDRYSQALHFREAKADLIRSRKFVQVGDYRVIGQDQERRPVLYMCMSNQLLPGSQAVDQIFVSILQAIDNMPDGVEQATHIWDLHAMSLRLNLSPAPLVQLLKSNEAYFAERMHKLIIIDMPRFASFLKDAVWPMVPEKTREKVSFLSPEEAKEYIGGACEPDVAERITSAMTENRDPSLTLEQRRKTWKRVNPRGELVPLME